jgi:hypothetical protein
LFKAPFSLFALPVQFLLKREKGKQGKKLPVGGVRRGVELMVN